MPSRRPYGAASRIDQAVCSARCIAASNRCASTCVGHERRPQDRDHALADRRLGLRIEPEDGGADHGGERVTSDPCRVRARHLRGRRGDQPGEHGLALAERAGVRAIVRGGPGDLVGQSQGEQVVRELRQRQVEQLRQLHERVGRRVDPRAVPVHPGSAHEVGRHLLLRAEVVVQARRAEPAGVGEGLDRRPAVPVAAEDRGGQREQLSASRLAAGRSRGSARAGTPEPRRSHAPSRQVA